MKPFPPVRFYRPSTIFAGFIPLIGACLIFNSSAQAEDRSKEIRDFTGAPTKVVWLRDTGDLPAVDAERPTLKLMGIDTEDGKGERVILDELARYWKPLISPDGTRVFFGKKDDNAVYVVNWDGTGRKRLLENARFDDIWVDPKTGTEWLYATTQESRDGKDVPVIRRYRTDNLSVSELVWDKMPIFMFTLSGDGRSASGGGDGGNSPQGMITLPNGNFYQRAGGCWPSIAPDASQRMWVFTGNHRSVHMFFPTNRSGNAYGETVRWDESPGLTLKGGEEVHRIRWSNNVRFFTVASPFAEWSYKSDVKVPKHVADRIEIYIGKFAEDLRTVEKWVAVTANEIGDYWSDVWVKPSAVDQASAVAVAELPDEPVSEKIDERGLVFVWETGAQGNQINDPQTGQIRQCTGQLRGEARFGLHHVMDLTGGSFVPDATVEPLLAQCKASNQFALEAILTPLGQPTGSEKVIFAFADDLATGNVTITQQNDELRLRLKTESTAPNTIPIGRLPFNESTHVIVSYSSGKLGVYLNGKRALIPNSLAGGLGNWTAQPVIFGDSWKGGNNWPGTVEGIALLSREIPEAEARQRFARQHENRAKRKPVEPIVVEAKLVGTCPAADPQGIAPYRRCLSVQHYEVTQVLKGKLDEKDITIAQWSVLDGKIFPGYSKFIKDQTYRLTIEPWESHPEQESERLISGDFDATLPLFYDVTRPEVAASSAQASSTGIAAAEGNPWSEVQGKWQLTAPLTVQGVEKPDAFQLSSAHPRNTAGWSVLFQNSSITEVPVEGSLRLGGGNSVATISVLNGGSGLQQAPEVTINGGGGSGASAVATLSVESLDVIGLGSGYTSAPTVTFSEPEIAGGQPATAIAEIDKTNGAIKSIRLQSPGSGYLRPPKVTISGGEGSGAKAEAQLRVSAITVLNGGSGYTEPPAIEFGNAGAGIEARAALQLTTLRYTSDQGNALLLNRGTLDQDGALIEFDWAAERNNTGIRGIRNEAEWTLRRGSVIQFGSSTGRPFWGISVDNRGTLRLLDGSRIGSSNWVNSGTLELVSGAVLGQVEMAPNESKLANLGEVRVIGGAANQPIRLGLTDPARTGKRLIENGSEDGSATARFVVGDGKLPVVFETAGGQTQFLNQPGGTVEIQPQATLALLTNDNGSQNRFENREAKLTNAGEIRLAGTLRVQGNHGGFIGIANRGKITVSGETATVERLQNSTGPGGSYRMEMNSAQLLNLDAGRIEGSGKLTYLNQTGEAEARVFRVINRGTLAPGRLQLVNTNVEIGSTATEKKGNQEAEAAAGGTFEVNAQTALTLTGEGDTGQFVITDGVPTILNLVTARPKGTHRLVTATGVKGTFSTLQLSGQPSTAYTVNYLPDGIEVVFP